MDIIAGLQAFLRGQTEAHWCDSTCDSRSCTVIAGLGGLAARGAVGDATARGKQDCSGLGVVGR
jgi:hypothetical protein